MNEITRQSSTKVCWVVVLLHIALPFASPFANAGGGSAIGSNTHLLQYSTAAHGASHLRPPNRPILPWDPTTTTGLSVATETTTDAASNDMEAPRLNRFFVPAISKFFHSAPGYDPVRSGEEGASGLSQVFFNYASGIVKIASTRRLRADDAFPLPAYRRMERSVVSLSRIYAHLLSRHRRRQVETRQVWNANSNSTEHTMTPPSPQPLILAQALLLHQRHMLLLTGLLRLMNTCVQAFPSILVARLLRLIEAGQDEPVAKAVMTAAQLVVILSMKMVTENLYFHNVVKFSTAVRGSLSGLIFDKSLRLPAGGSEVMQTDDGDAAKQQTLGPGGVLNLMQSDTGIIESAALQFHTTWDGPLQIAIYTTLLFRYLGPSVLWGISVLLLTIPINSVTLRVLNRLAKYENEAKDARTKRTAESLSNMKLLKLQGWEQQFADDIRRHRRDELRHHVTRGLVRAVNSAVSNAVPAIVLVVTLTAYVKTGRPIVASTIFTAISLFNQLRFPLFFYPMLIDALANGRNAMRRISTFLSAPEIVPYVEHLPLHDNGGGSIEMRHGNFLWSFPSIIQRSNLAEPATDAALANVNLKICPGEVVAVIGTVGSGKSALLKGLLGELNPIAVSTNITDSVGIVSPLVVAHGDIAYCSQEAWLSKGSIREAIVFGRPFDQERYEEAIRDAGLNDDIVSTNSKVNGAMRSTEKPATSGVLSHDTQVGEGGSSLSGGQRARVALARALYSGDETKVYLLDDCLAALDSRVGSTVFERLTRRLRKSKAATILVTNDPSIPRRCDRVILMGSIPGTGSCSGIVDIGTYDELMSRGHNLRSITSDDDVSSAMAEASLSPDSDPPLLTSTSTKGSFVNPSDTDCFFSENCADAITNVVKKPTLTEDDFRDEELPVLVRHSEGAHVISKETSDLVALVVDDSRTTSPQEINPTEIESVSSTQRNEKPASADDMMSVGSVPLSTYILYFKSVGNPLLVAAMFSSFLMSNGAQFFQQYTVAKWTEVSGGALGSAVSLGYMRSLVNAAGVVSVFLWIRSILLMQVGVKVSAFLHSKMLGSVFASPMSFFDSTSSGQLMVRFGAELQKIDAAVPDSIGSCIFCGMNILMSAGALIGVISSGMVFPIGMIAVLYVRMMSLFRPAARDMKRAETKTRSPIYTHFGETIRGSEVIRSIRGARERWSSKHQSLSDANLLVFYTVKVLDRWLSTRLESLGNLAVFAAAVASVFLTRAGRLKAGSAGWGLTQSLAITGLLTWAVRCLTDLESNMMSVMRVTELTDLESDVVDNIVGVQRTKSRSIMPKELVKPGEAMQPLISTSQHIHVPSAPLNSAALMKSGWPWRGNVQFRNVSMRYGPSSPLVLKDISLTIPAGSTLGIVGRSGSGKSSLLLVLFRLFEIESSNGAILIDGVDTRSVSMTDLRQSLAIIPQDPVLFTGTLAYNLDATGTASPEDMLQALNAASPELAASLNKIGGLAAQISNNHLSLGERQLLCLARALTKKSKLLILDEATASVDLATDQEVQATIRREFVDKGVTVLTVAHRLDSVLGYDRIAVLGDGRLLEYGTPEHLLSIPGGEFQRLVQADRLNKQKGARRKVKEDKMIPISV